MKVAVIGAGLGGLAVAVRLARAGHSVDVYEANPYAGGKAAVYEVGEFRFDAGLRCLPCHNISKIFLPFVMKIYKSTFPTTN